MADDVGQAAREQPVDKMICHAPRHGGFRHRCFINKRAAVDVVADQPAPFHFSENGRHGGVSQVLFSLELLMKVGHGGVGARPEDFHDSELEIPEAMNFGATHDRACEFNYPSNTTSVVYVKTFSLLARPAMRQWLFNILLMNRLHPGPQLRTPHRAMENAVEMSLTWELQVRRRPPGKTGGRGLLARCC